MNPKRLLMGSMLQASRSKNYLQPRRRNGKVSGSFVFFPRWHLRYPPMRAGNDDTMKKNGYPVQQNRELVDGFDL
jgi:hypothetical protein